VVDAAVRNEGEGWQLIPQEELAAAQARQLEARDERRVREVRGSRLRQPRSSGGGEQHTQCIDA
jgi:hypothetical protein